MIRIIVEQTAIRSIPYTDKKGQPATLRVQSAFAFVPDQDGNISQYPEKFEILLGRDQPTPYARGVYTLHPSALYVDQRGRLAVTPRLAPVAQTAAQPAAVANAR